MSQPPEYPIFAVQADEMDERTPGVLLLSCDGYEGDGWVKETARDDIDSWWVQAWETWQMEGLTYWRTTGGYRIDKSTVVHLAEAQGDHACGWQR